MVNRQVRDILSASSSLSKYVNILLNQLKIDSGKKIVFCHIKKNSMEIIILMCQRILRRL